MSAGRKIEEWFTLDTSIHHGRYVPNDNVVRIFTETFDCSVPSEFSETNRLRLMHIFSKIVGMHSHLIDGYEKLDFNKMTVEIENDAIKITGFSNSEKSFYMEATKTDNKIKPCLTRRK